MRERGKREEEDTIGRGRGREGRREGGEENDGEREEGGGGYNRERGRERGSKEEDDFSIHISYIQLRSTLHLLNVF